MKLQVWDGESAVVGIEPETLREGFPVPAGGVLVLVFDDSGEVLQSVQNIWPGRAGLVPIRQEDVDSGALQADLQIQAPTDDAPAPVDLAALAQQVNDQQATLDALVSMIVEGA
jgi:hypothetical protein